jgi:ketosteroid isomerase-like protein
MKSVVAAGLLAFGVMFAPNASACSCAPAESERGPSVALGAERHAIGQVTSRFLASFENLDMPAFIGCFAEDATVFFPAPEPPERFSGKAAIQTHFQQVFDSIRKSASSGPPYHRLIPENLEVQLLGADAAVVSFHLRNTERIARRTLVLKKVHGVWQIAHLHASNVPLAPGLQP